MTSEDQRQKLLKIREIKEMISEDQRQKLLKIRLECPHCKGEGVIAHDPNYMNVYLCQCHREIELKYKYYEAGIPEKFISTTPSDFLNKVPDRVVKYTRHLKKWFDRGIGLYLFGPNGTGKSLLSAEIAKYAIRQGYSVKFISLEHFLKATLENSSELDDIREADLIALEEIEKVYKPTRDNSFADIIFDDFFRTRSNQRKVTCITSNCDLNGLKGVHGKHIVSLLKEDLITVEVEGKDFRENLAEELGEELDNENV
jgi:DNA replication protein DnaC